MSKEYWEGAYYDYLKARVDEANTSELSGSSLIPSDIKIPSDATYQFFVDQMDVKPESTVLDVGCGFGRTFPIFFEKRLSVTGVDISSKMIKEAHKVFGDHPKLTELTVSPAEALPFGDNAFDYLVSFGTFDSTNQALALSEFLRVLKEGGLACISGKNFTYANDDELAYEAECGAKAKGHPNSFSYYEKLISQLKDQDVSVEREMFFCRRGDTTDLVFEKDRPDFFYEFTIYLKKNRQIHHAFEGLHSPESAVWLDRNR